MKQRLRAVFHICLFFAIGSCLAAESQVVRTPGWLTWLDQGTGAYACASGTCTLSGENQYTSFTLSAGAKLVNSAGNRPLIVRATGACTIAGTVSGSPNSGAVGITGNGDFGGGGGGGGGGTVAGTGGKTTVVVPGVPIVNGGPPGAAGGGAGRSALSVQQGQYRMLLSSGSSDPGGGAQGGRGGSSGGLGGNGGTPIIFICHSISFSGSIDVSGGAGRIAPADSTGAGGGGGAGYVIFAAVSYTNSGGTFNINGGVGGSCNGHGTCGAGGNGGNGFSIFLPIQ
jgi:hypothetical protein